MYIMNILLITITTGVGSLQLIKYWTVPTQVYLGVLQYSKESYSERPGTLLFHSMANKLLFNSGNGVLHHHSNRLHPPSPAVPRTPQL